MKKDKSKILGIGCIIFAVFIIVISGMACKDASGNMTCISAEFFKITLDYGDATCPVRYIVGLEGNTVTLPNPEKLGYTFEGWEQTE